ncbi:unnamed protein product [Prunus armeniaca]
MVSQDQSKDSGSKKNGGKEFGMVTPQGKPLKKMKFVSSAETEPTSTTTISEDSKSGRGMSTMPRVVKRKFQKIKPVVEYNKRGKGCGPAHTEMQSYIDVLARSRVPLVDKKWAEIPKDIKEQIWEAVDMAFVVSQGGKNSVLSSAAKKWKDFNSTLTRHFILPYIKEREKLSQPRYAGLEDQLEETMPGVEIDRSTLWKKARQDKRGNIPDPKDELQKRVSEGSLSVSGSNDVLTMALGPEHPGRVRGVGAGISPRQYFNLPKQQRIKFADHLKEGVRIVLQEETKKMEARSREETLRMEARTKQLGTEVVDYSNVEVPSSLQSLCRYVETTLKPQEKIMTFTIEKEVFGADRSTFVLHEDITQLAGMEEIGATEVAVCMRCLYDCLREANMCSMVGFIDPAQVSANAGSLIDRSRIVASRLQKTDGEQIFMMPYNPGRHWVLLIVRAKRETVYFLDPLLGNRVVDEEGKNIVNSALKIYNSHIGKPGRKAPIWKTLPGTPKQPNSVECGYYVMRFMRDIIMDPSLEFEKKFAKGKEQAPYPQAAIDEVRNEWAEFVCLHME